MIPRAKRTEAAGERNGALLVRLSAPPVEGAANESLIEFISDALGVPRRSVRIVSGDKRRLKCVAVAGVTEETVRSRLLGQTR